jgi:hypothetical protein
MRSKGKINTYWVKQVVYRPLKNLNEGKTDADWRIKRNQLRNLVNHYITKERHSVISAKRSSPSLSCNAPKRWNICHSSTQCTHSCSMCRTVRDATVSGHPLICDCVYDQCGRSSHRAMGRASRLPARTVSPLAVCLPCRGCSWSSKPR